MIDLNAKAFDLDSLINESNQNSKNTPPVVKKEEQEKTKSEKKSNSKDNKTKQQPKNINENKVEKKQEQKIESSQIVEAKQSKVEVSKIQNKDETIDNRLIIGQNDKHNDFYISENCRYLNMAIIGSKGTGKTTSLLPFFAEQDISKKMAGATFIVSDKEMAYGIYSLCKKYKRKVHLLKPTTNNEINNKFLWKTEYDYDDINEHIINYKEAIRRKEIVIIDMEVFKYKIDAIRATSMLLLQLRLDLADTDITQRNPHFLYVDDAYYYIRFLEDFLRYGSTYNLGTILFLESRSQLLTKEKDLRMILDDNVRNYLLLNKLTVDDFNYYKSQFPEKIFDGLQNREKTTLTFQTVDPKGLVRTGISKLKQINTIDLKELEKKSKKIRTSLLKEKRKERENELRSKMENSQFSNEPKPIDDKLLESLVNDSNTELQIPTQNKETLEQINAEIKEKIREEEKVTKRKAAENIYNNYEKHIEFCDDLFKFD